MSESSNATPISERRRMFHCQNDVIPIPYIRPLATSVVPSTGQFVGFDTGIINTYDIAYQIDLSGLSSTQAGGICGAYGKGIGISTSKQLTMSRWDNNPEIADIDISKPLSIYFPANIRYHPIKINGKVAHLVKGGSAISSSRQVDQSVAIYTCYWYEIPDKFAVFNLHRFRVWSNNHIIRDYRPAVNNGTVCLFDRIEGTYLYPTGGLSFNYYER